MKNYNIFKAVAIITVAAFLFSSCSGLKKMQKDYGKVKFKATPDVLQTKGGKIAVNVSGTIPEKYFKKKVKMTITPILKYGGASTTLNTIALKGEKADGEGAVIKTTGGAFNNGYTIDYKPEMLVSELKLEGQLIYKKKTIDLPDVKVADGVIITETRIDNTDADVQLAEHEYQKATTVTKTADIYFPYSLFKFDKNLKLNKLQENIDKLKDLENYIVNGWKIQSININGWASPEGEEKYNQHLSKDRATTGDKYLQDMFASIEKEKIAALQKEKMELAKEKGKKEEVKKEKKEIAEEKGELKELKKEQKELAKQNKEKKAPEYQLNIAGNGEDKDGFVAVVKKSNLKDKDAIINVIESQVSMAQRVKKMKDMTIIYDDVENLLAPLRKAEFAISYLEPKKTDEQIARLSTTHPDSLDIKELLYSATLTKDNNTKLQIYKSAVSLHPDSWNANNNLGYINFTLGKYDEASTYFEKSNTLSANNGIVLNNLGAIALAKNNLAAAKSYYESAKEKGVNTDFNMGIILITEGNYDEAVKDLQSKKCDYNLALAQLLLNNTSGAQSTLECAGQNGEVYYLMAVIGARTQNVQMMNDNLKKAIGIDAKYRKQASTDMEFIKYFNNADFMAITK